MALKLVRKKTTTVAAGRRKKGAIEKFKDAIEVQMRLASGEKVKKGKGIAKSWMEDGKEYGVSKVLNPRVGNVPLYNKSAIAVDVKQKKPPTIELKELLARAADGKLAGPIYKAVRKKKAGAAKNK